MENHEIEVWLRMYEEQVRHARHHETLRSQSANVIIVLSAGILAFLSSEYVSSGQHVVLATFLVLANAYGFVMSMKHYERNRLHVAVAGRYRSLLSQCSALDGCTVNEEREIGHNGHFRDYRIMGRLRTHLLWSGLHIVILFVAVLLVLDRINLEQHFSN